MELMPHQLEAIEHLGTGKVLYGGVGSGKSATVLAYYMKKEAPKHIYVFTTAKKRDSLDWEREAAKFGISDAEVGVVDGETVIGRLNVDSWNNIHKYSDVQDAFIIFDEQRLVGYGSWVKGFFQLAKRNNWVLLSATPGDTWLDYAPIFIANGFYRNITHFKLEHVLYEPFNRYPKVRMYLNEPRLEMLRNDILVEMPYMRDTTRYLNYVDVGYDTELMNTVIKRRWNPYDECPIKDVAEMFRLMRRVVNSDPSRLENLRYLMGIHPRLIVFYNFNYELDILRTLSNERQVLEWNGHKKDELPKSGDWVYLVQYNSGAEGWNCTSTNAMTLYSLTYSYKMFVQAQGRIDRLDTDYKSLYYYIFVSNSKIDKAIKAALDQKKTFNWRKSIRAILGNEEIVEVAPEMAQI